MKNNEHVALGVNHEYQILYTITKTTIDELWEQCPILALALEKQITLKYGENDDDFIAQGLEKHLGRDLMYDTLMFEYSELRKIKEDLPPLTHLGL